MSDAQQSFHDGSQVDHATTEKYLPPTFTAEANVISVARVTLSIAYGAFIALVAVILVPPLAGAMFKVPIYIGFNAEPGAGPMERFFGHYMIHIVLGLIAIVALVASHRMVKAAGGNFDVVIPPQDYPLLGPLVEKGKGDAIDLYVKLSTLRGPTGFFSKLGLTGLPLATISLTLIFSILAMIQSGNGQFFDLAKLTLGAFIGSFVQRQVETRGADNSAETKSLVK